MTVKSDPGFSWRHPIQILRNGDALPADTIRYPIMASSRLRIHVKLASGSGSININLGRGVTDTVYTTPAQEVLALSTTEASWETDQVFGEPYLYLEISGTGVVDFFDLCQL